MSTTTKWLAVLIVIILIIAGVWLSQDRQSGPVDIVKIGTILALTGNQQDVGQSMMRGIQLAQDEINKSKSSRAQLQVSFEDSQADPKTGLTAYRKLADVDGLKIFVIAHSNVSDPVSRAAAKDGNLAFNIYSSATNLTQIGDLVFRNEIQNEPETSKLVDFARSQKYGKAALLTVNTEGSQNSAKLFKNKFVVSGGKILVDEKYEKTEKDFQTFLTKIKNSQADFIFLVASPKQGGQILKKAKELEINLPIVSDFHVEGPEMLAVAGAAANGLVYTHTTDLNSNNPLVKDFVAAYQNKYHQAPDYFSAVAYDSAKMIYQAAKDCSDRKDMNCLRDELLKIKNYPGITGLTTIGPNRETDKTIILKTVKNGQFVTLEN